MGRIEMWKHLKRSPGFWVFTLTCIAVAYAVVPSEGPRPQRMRESAAEVTVHVSRAPQSSAPRPIGRLDLDVEPRYYLLVMRIASTEYARCLRRLVVCRGVWDERDRSGEVLSWPRTCPRGQVARRSRDLFMLRWYFYGDPEAPPIASTDGFPTSMSRERRAEIASLPDCAPEE